VAEELPRPRAGLAKQLVANACRIQARLDAPQVRRRERDVVDDARALHRRRAVEVEVHERVRRVAVQPCAVEAELRALAFAQAEHADVELERLLPVLGDDGDVVDADDHDASPRCQRRRSLARMRRSRRARSRAARGGYSGSRARTAGSRAASRASRYTNPAYGHIQPTHWAAP
jgi:hypothetical protein